MSTLTVRAEHVIHGGPGDDYTQVVALPFGRSPLRLFVNLDNGAMALSFNDDQPPYALHTAYLADVDAEYFQKESARIIENPEERVVLNVFDRSENALHAHPS